MSIHKRLHAAVVTGFAVTCSHEMQARTTGSHVERIVLPTGMWSVSECFCARVGVRCVRTRECCVRAHVLFRIGRMRVVCLVCAHARVSELGMIKNAAMLLNKLKVSR